jgi:hypothetical protein
LPGFILKGPDLFESGPFYFYTPDPIPIRRLADTVFAHRRKPSSADGTAL